MLFYSLCVLTCMAGVTVALPQPGQPAAPAPTPLGTISYNIPGILNSTLTPFLGKGSKGGLEVGGIGSHDTPGGEVHEHGTGDAQIGPGGVEICLTQTFVVKPVTISYGIALGGPDPCQTPAASK